MHQPQWCYTFVSVECFYYLFLFYGLRPLLRLLNCNSLWCKHVWHAFDLTVFLLYIYFIILQNLALPNLYREGILLKWFGLLPTSPLFNGILTSNCDTLYTRLLSWIQLFYFHTMHWFYSVCHISFYYIVAPWTCLSLSLFNFKSKVLQGSRGASHIAVQTQSRFNHGSPRFRAQLSTQVQ